MRRILSELVELRSLSEQILASGFTGHARMRIILIGIMLNLILSGIILLFIILFALRVLPNKHKVIIIGLENTTEERGMQNTLKENTLSYIPQIIRKVGMFMIGSSAEPLRESLFSKSPWSFDPCLGISSEGFLATFTPGPVEKGLWRIKFSYSLLPVFEFCFGFIQNSTTQPKVDDGKKEAGKYSPLPQHQVNYLVVRKEGKSVRTSQVHHRSPGVNFGDPETIHSRWGMRIRVNLMTLASRSWNPGILVASNPTDEGRLGTGRNTYYGKTLTPDEEIG
jgi:hypothetical protein